MREISAFYGAFAAGGVPSPPPLAVQYADYAAWQREWLQGELLEREIGHWRERLAGAPSLLELPADRPRPAVQTSRGAVCPLELPPQIVAPLQALGRRQGVTLFISLLAALYALLARLSDQEDVCVGSPIAGRGHQDLEPLIGFFVNTLVLRTSLAGEPTFEELLGRVREVTLEAFMHQELPFEKLVEELAPERSLAYSPLFQVLFVLQNAPTGALEIPGLTAELVPLALRTSRYDLELSLDELTDAVAGAFGYNADLFDAVTVQRWSSQLRNVLAAALARPDTRLSALDVMSVAERHQLLVEWRGAAPAGTAEEESWLHQLFAAQARATPEALALVCGGRRLSYRQLATRASRLAWRLRAAGVGPETLVGVCLERGPDLVPALLAVLAAGGAYVPLDPAYPDERLALILDDARVPVLLSRGCACCSTIGTSRSPAAAMSAATAAAASSRPRPGRQRAGAWDPIVSPTSSTPRARPAARRAPPSPIAAPRTCCAGRPSASRPRSSRAPSPRPPSASTSRCSSCSRHSAAAAPWCSPTTPSPCRGWPAPPR